MQAVAVCVRHRCTRALTDDYIKVCLTDEEFTQCKAGIQRETPEWRECRNYGKGDVYDVGVSRFR